MNTKKIDLQSDAKLIARIIRHTDTDYRGDLFKLVADELAKHSQFATAAWMEKMAKEYGLSEGKS